MSPYSILRQKKMSEDRIADVLIVGGYLTIIILRLCNVIDWNWLWILCPFWIPIVGMLIGLIIGALICIPVIIYKKIRGIKNEWY